MDEVEKATVRSDRTIIRTPRRGPIVTGLCEVMTKAIDNIPGTAVTEETTRGQFWGRSLADVTNALVQKCCGRPGFRFGQAHTDAAMKSRGILF